jgi:hypothetical protein
MHKFFVFLGQVLMIIHIYIYIYIYIYIDTHTHYYADDIYLQNGTFF